MQYEYKMIQAAPHIIAQRKMWGSDNICIGRNKKIWREKMR